MGQLEQVNSGFRADAGKSYGQTATRSNEWWLEPRAKAPGNKDLKRHQSHVTFAAWGWGGGVWPARRSYEEWVPS